MFVKDILHQIKKISVYILTVICQKRSINDCAPNFYGPIVRFSLRHCPPHQQYHLKKKTPSNQNIVKKKIEIKSQQILPFRLWVPAITSCAYQKYGSLISLRSTIEWVPSCQKLKSGLFVFPYGIPWPQSSRPHGHCVLKIVLSSISLLVVGAI